MTRWRVAWTIGALAVVVIYLHGIGAALANYDEPIYAEFVRAMERGAGWMHLEYQGAQTLQRPPTSVWVYVAASQLAPGEVGLRLGPVACTVAAALVAGAAVRRVFDDRLGAVVAVAVAAGAPSALVYGRLLLSDPPFVLAVAIATWATLAAQAEPRRLTWAAGAVGAAFAFKSFAAAIPLAALAPWWLVAWRRHRDAAPVGRAAAAFVALAAPYFVAGFAAHGARFWDEHVVAMVLDRARGELAPIIGIGGPGAYVEHVWRADGPVFAVLLFGGVAGAAAWAWRHRDAELGAAATAAAATFVLLGAVSTRLAHYLLVFYPLAAICLGGLVARALPRVRTRVRGIPALAGALAMSAFAIGIARGPFDAGALPSESSRALGGVAASQLAPGERLYALDWYTPALGYYADRPFTLLSTSPELAAMLAGSDPFRQAGNAAVAPPWPAGVFALACAEERMPPPGLTLVHLFATADGFALAQVRAEP
jgi:4-amino-4-deoxy-L-arabinose transferase-like glycosyltransferase